MGMKCFGALLYAFLLCGLSHAQNGLEISFSHERGLYAQSFSLQLTPSQPSANIRYTTNGSKPSPSSGTLYTGSINISTTTSFRAIAWSATDTSEVYTHSFIYLNDVISSSVMSTAITQDPLYGLKMESSLKALPYISLVSPSIVSNNHVDIERETSVEMFFKDNTTAFQIDCGIQTWGGSPTNPKKSYRLEFKSEYGASRLEYPVFEDDGYDYPIEPARSFNKLLLRAGSQDGLNAEFGAEAEATFVRNRFLMDVQMAMGYPMPHGRYVHVFVNGEYMGQYHLMERPDDGFFASYYLLMPTAA